MESRVSLAATLTYFSLRCIYTAYMKVLLTDGSGSHLATGGHAAVGRRPRGGGRVAYAARALRLHAPRAAGAPRCRPSGAIRRGGCRLSWMSSAAGEFDVLLPTQEQVTILARDCCAPPDSRWRCPRSRACCACRTRWRSCGCSRSWGCRTPRPPSRPTVAAWNRFPVFAKAPIGTASQGVRLVRGPGLAPRRRARLRRRPRGPAGAAGRAAGDGAGDLRLRPPGGLARDPARARGGRRRVELEAERTRTRRCPAIWRGWGRSSTGTERCPWTRS